MPRYSYSSRFEPPAPVLLIKVSAPDSPLGLTLEAKSDFDDVTVTRSVHAGEVATEFTAPEIVRVIPRQGDYALLGRDIINRWKAVLDGPQKILEITT